LIPDWARHPQQGDATSPPVLTADEAAVARLMAAVLRIQPIDATEDFFDRGGESILALELTLRISEELDVQVRTDHIYRYPTPALLAQAIADLRSGAASAVDLEDRVLAFNERGPRAPFFFVHAGNVSASFCELLAAHLGPDWPVYGLPLYGGSFGPVPRTIEAMAQRYLEVIDTCCPSGPVVIGGFGRSTLPAFEIAQRLTTAGRDVDALVLIGGRVPNVRRPWKLLQRLNNTLAWVTAVDDGARIERFLEWRRTVGVARAKMIGRRPAFDVYRVSDDQPLDVKIPLQYKRARAAYVPSTYSGRTVFLAIDTDTADNGWGRVIPRLEIQPVRGNHRTAFTVHAPLLSDAIKSALSESPAGR
jgi:thioesterase domain-containing protein/acyl carrier protein